MPHPVLAPRNVAVVTGGASGIGLAAARKFIGYGMRVAIADLPGDALAAAERDLGTMGVAMAVPTDVSKPEALKHLEVAVVEAMGGIDLLMNNAGVQPGSDIFGPAANWTRVIETNLLGIVQGTQIIVPGMLARGKPGLVINTGSKQGITTPPGDPAYNVAKAGVKAFTEALQHHLRNVSRAARVTRASASSRATSSPGSPPGAARRSRRRRGHRSRPWISWSRAWSAATSTSCARTTTCRAPDRRAPHPVGGRRHRREPPAAVALARRLQGRLRCLREAPVAGLTVKSPSVQRVFAARF